MYFIAGMGRGPQVGRRVELKFGGDWGQANFHRIASWLGQEVYDRTQPGSRFSVWNTSGGSDALRAVAEGELDFAISTPARFATMAVNGSGPFKGKPLRNLSAVAVFPQKDRLVLAIDKKFGIRTYAQLIQRAPALRVALSPDDGRNFIGYATARLLEACSMSVKTFEDWGGHCLVWERPEQCVAAVRAHEADAIIQEAIMTPWWAAMMNERQLELIPVPDAALHSLGQSFGWQGAAIEAGYFESQTETVRTLDFSDFILVTRNDMPDDIVHLVCWCITETSATLERYYHSFPPDRSPLGYPLSAYPISQSPIPLHPAASEFYESRAQQGFTANNQ